jgi:hypothetical protein
MEVNACVRLIIVETNAVLAVVVLVNNSIIKYISSGSSN